MRRRVWRCLGLGVAVIGCHKDPAAAPQVAVPLASAATSVSAGVPDPEAEFTAIRARAVPAVNERVPAALTKVLKFAPQFDARHRVIGLVPESWMLGQAPGTFIPPPVDALGPGTSLAFGSGCDGRCAPKDWAQSFDKVEVRGLQAQQIDSDEPMGKSGRLVVAHSGDTHMVAAGLWKAGAASYFYCRATLTGAAIEALPAFVAACRATEVRRWE